MVFYIPASPMTWAIKRRLRQEGLRYKVGNLGELMQENYDQARRNKTLRYSAEDLRLLRGVRENPEVVDIAFELVQERLAAKGVALPTACEERVPYDFDYVKITALGLGLAALMTLLISLAVVFVSNIAVMTTLIVLISIAAAAFFIWASYTKLIVSVR